MIALHDGESDTVRYVQCGRRELSGGGGGLTPKKGIEHRERIERVSTCMIALHDGESGMNVSRQLKIAPSATSTRGQGEGALERTAQTIRSQR